MKTLFPWARRGFAVVVVIGILGFGAQEVRAANRAHGVMVCENYPMCSSEEDCDSCCEFLGHTDGFCTMAGACFCS